MNPSVALHNNAIRYINRWPKEIMEIVQALHVALNVSDLAVAEQFYGQVLGLPRVDRNLKFPGVWYQIGAFQVHLIPVAATPAEGEAGEIAPLWDQARWGRNRHLAFAVLDLAQAHQQLIDAGCPVQLSASGRAALFTQDPDGNLIELSEQTSPILSDSTQKP